MLLCFSLLICHRFLASADRKYTGWVGESCGRGTREDTEIRTIDCEGLSGRDCEEMCISECNKDKVRLWFVVGCNVTD